MSFPGRIALLLLVGLAAIYLAVCAGAWFLQRGMIYHPNPVLALPPAGGPPIESVRIRTADGEALVAWWLPPKPGKPSILYFGGNASSLAGEQARWRIAAEAGVGFLGVAYRGYDGSTGRPSETGLREDARAAYGWLAARVPARDIVVQGHSLGSGVATRLASERPVRALVLEAPFSAAVDIGAAQMPWLPVRLLMRDQYRSREVIGKVAAPVLIVHGDADAVIPIASGRRLYGFARAPKMFVRVSGADHNSLVRDGVYDVVWPFLGLSLEATTAAPGHKVRMEVVSEGVRPSDSLLPRWE